ncbi:hypothetical protein [Fibrobacter sp. UWB5]|uniref:hypothetical protein n=1 Tax=Fibrobacter sp. UWB5 TaxID=1964360 RepID=UPI001E563FC6|nr:hypothetical protein [Fibrobacter sp. UWB5]
MIADEDDSSIEEELSTCSSAEDDRACEIGSLEEDAGMVEDDMAEDNHSGESCSDDDTGIQE